MLSAAAVDRMHDGVRTNYNKELWAQGVGNMPCGAAGALPMTGVIVHSSANVQAGAQTRLSAILHGVWILAFVALLPWLLREIPMAALGAILVVTALVGAEAPSSDSAGSVRCGSPTSRMTLDGENGAPGTIRTSDPQIRSLMLYPAELRALGRGGS